MRVLVIDDDTALRQTIRRMLESAGHEVTEAANGRAGLEAHRKQPAEVVISDIIMPDKEGIETIREIRAWDPRIRIIAISGGAMNPRVDFLEMAGKLGASATLAKPFLKEELLSCVEGRQASAKNQAG